MEKPGLKKYHEMAGDDVPSRREVDGGHRGIPGCGHGSRKQHPCRCREEGHRGKKRQAWMS